MADYIDRGKMLAELSGGWFPQSVEYTEAVEIAKSIINGAPAENVVSYSEYDVERLMVRQLRKCLEKAEHDRDRYARKIAELEEHQIADMEMFKTLRADTARDIQTRVAVYFGTYTDKDVIKVADVFKIINRIVLEILEAEEE